MLKQNINFAFEVNIMSKITLELTISAHLIACQNNCDHVILEGYIDFQQALIFFQEYAHEILNQISLLRGPYNLDEYEVASTDFTRYCEIIDLHIMRSHLLLSFSLLEIRNDAREIARHWQIQVSSRWSNYLVNSRLRECIVSPEELRRRADIINLKTAAFFGINIATRLIFGYIGEVAANAPVAWVALENVARIAASSTVSAALNTAAVHYIDPDANGYEAFKQSAQKACLFNTFNQAGHDVIRHAGQIGLEQYEYYATSITELSAGAVDAYILNSMGQPAPIARPGAFNREVIDSFDNDLLRDWVHGLVDLVENTGSMTSSLSGSSFSFYSNAHYRVGSEDANDVNYDFVNDDGMRHRRYSASSF